MLYKNSNALYNQQMANLENSAFWETQVRLQSTSLFILQQILTQVASKKSHCQLKNAYQPNW